MIVFYNLFKVNENSVEKKNEKTSIFVEFSQIFVKSDDALYFS